MAGEKFYFSGYFFGRFGIRFFSDRVKKLVVYLHYMTLLWISGEDETNWILIIRIRLVFLYVDGNFDVPNCKYAWKKSTWKCWLCFHLFFVVDTKMICGYNFVAPLIRLKLSLLCNFLSDLFEEFVKMRQKNKLRQVNLQAF